MMQNTLMERIEHGWDVSAEGYARSETDKDLSPQAAEALWGLISENVDVSRRLRILDAGCGPGILSIICALRGHDVVGIDISQPMLDRARANAERFKVSVDFRRMDCQDPEFEDGVFDLVVNRYVLWALPEPRRAMESWYRVLRKGGTLVVMDNGHPVRDAGYIDDHEAPYKAFKEHFGVETPASYSDYEEARGWKRDVPLTYAARPEFDFRTMRELGMEGITYTDAYDRFPFDEMETYRLRRGWFYRITGRKPL